jgi:hypothetical protein
MTSVTPLQNVALSNFFSLADTNLSRVMPAELVVDYVRLYQDSSLPASEALSCSPPSRPTAQVSVCV